MLPVELSDANLRLGPPPGWTDEQCMTISAYRGKDGHGIDFVVTAWMPSAEDLEALNAGRPMFLKFSGVLNQQGEATMMPAELYTTDENNVPNV